MKNIEIPYESLMEAVIQGYENGCNELVISGGEPTLYPEYIIGLMSLALTLGYKKFIIQTNGYGLSKYDKLISFLDSHAKTTDICLSFSIHGHVADIHDELSGNAGAFNYLVDALGKVSKTQCKIYTNTVINARNLFFLKDLALFLNLYKPEIMQFSVMHLKEKNELSISLEESVWAIKKLKGIVNLDVLKTEGVPYCLLHGMESCVGESAWPSVLDLYNKSNDYIIDFKQLDYGMRCKMEHCEECVMNKICMGVWAEHFEEFFNMGIHPIV